VLHRGIEIGRPRHAVPRGKHRCDTRLANQAVSERRPLRRRFDTTARPARVRIRSRKPCTRARRRLFGWKVRLPFATTLSSLHLASRSGPVTRAGRSRLPSRSLGRLCVSLVTGAGPGHIARIAAVSPTFGRLYEGTDQCSLGQTWPAQTSISRQSLTDVTPATGSAEQSYESRHQCCGTAPGNEARMADRLPGQLTYAGCLERRSCVPSGVSCGAMTTVLCTLVDNYVDSSWSQLKILVRSHTRGTRR
jgi:hypothetical protein